MVAADDLDRGGRRDHRLRAEVVVEVARNHHRPGGPPLGQVARRERRGALFRIKHGRGVRARDEHPGQALVVPVLRHDLRGARKRLGQPGVAPVAVEIEVAEIAVEAEAGLARLHHDQVQVPGEIEVGQQSGARLQPLEPRCAGRVADLAVRVELEHARILLTEHDHVVKAVIVQVSGQGDAVAGPGGHAQRPAQRREMAAAVVEQEKSAARFLRENARAPVVVVIDHGQRTAATGRQRAKGRGGVLRETDRNPVRIRLAQDEWRQWLGVLAAFQRGHGDDRAG